MSVDEEDQYTWHLGSTQRVLSTGEGRIFNVEKSISDDRHESYSASVFFLNEILTASAFAGLQERIMNFMRVSAAAAEAFKSGQSTADLSPQIRSSFDDLLSAFRRFVDRAPAALSRRYGSDSEKLAAFDKVRSQEFDNEFAYRFIYHLRNYSDHRGIPISRVAQSSKLLANQEKEHNFDVLLTAELYCRTIAGTKMCVKI